ncbi:MAG: hypothetical protein KJ804_12355 [Proteobacteria bacterium]|nr:hypothetical protein [Pseudomonadota bacterium]MBU1059096.1 hypothetical protein [Pseudomonadota bacterium]
MSKVVKIPEEYWPEIDALPGDLAFIARGLEQYLPGSGVQVTLILAQVFKGQPLYIRGIEELLLKIRNDAIRKEYDSGAKVKELAFKFDLSVRWVEDILAREEQSQEDKQMRLF